MAKTHFKTVKEEGLRLDQIVLEEYNNLDNWEKVLELNPHIQETLFIPQGTVLEMITVEIETEELKKVKAKELW